MVTVALSTVTGAPRAAASETEPRCFFATGPRLADITTAPANEAASHGAGDAASHGAHHVELFDGRIRIDGHTVSHCDGLPGAHPTAIAAWRGGFAIAFRDDGVHAWDAHGFHAVRGAPRRGVRSLAATGDTLWIGTANDGLLRVDGDAVRSIGPGSLARGAIVALHAEGSTLHVGADPGGWLTVDGGAVKLVQRAAIVGCFRKGAAGVAPRPPGPACADDVRDGALPSAHVTALASHRGKVVVGAFDRGVFAVDDAGVASPIANAPSHVNALLASGDRLFIGATSGLYVATAGGAAERVPLSNAAAHVNGLAEGRDGTIWAATSEGVVAWSSGRSRTLDDRDGLPSPLVYAVTETDDGALWIATARGVVRRHRGAVESFTTDRGTLSRDWVTSLLRDHDRVYAGTYDGGVFHLGAGGTSESVAALAGSWINPNGLEQGPGGVLAATLGSGLRSGDGRTLRGLPSDDVTATLTTSGVLWVGTRGGLARYAAPDRAWSPGQTAMR